MEDSQDAVAGNDKMSGKALAKRLKEERAQALQSAVEARGRGDTVSPEQAALMKDETTRSDNRRDQLVNTGIGAVGGLASGALQALLAKGPDRGGRAAIPTGGGGSIPNSATPGLNFSRSSITSDQRPSLALEMLKRGGYR